MGERDAIWARAHWHFDLENWVDFQSGLGLTNIEATGIRLRTLNQTQGTEQGKISKYTTKNVQENERGKGELFKQKDAPVGQDHQASYYH